MEKLFEKTVSVVIKSSDRDERQASVGVTVVLNTTTSPVHKKELVIRLTDESDPFFLFTLSLGESDFQGLKSQQGLLVDFTAFPQKFIDLLELCISDTGKLSPKFILQLSVPATDSGRGVLSVVEVNPFRHLNHLSLQFLLATDATLKKYMSECLLDLKTENAALSEGLAATRSDLSSQLLLCQESLNKRGSELEALKAEWAAQTSSMSSEHSASLAAERERSLQAQTELTSKFTREKRETEELHCSKVKSMDERIAQLDRDNKELTDHKYRSEAAIRELKTKLKSSEEECSRCGDELARVRRTNSDLDSSNHELDKTVSQLRTRIAVLEQELQDKEQVISRSSELLEASTEQKRSHETALEQTQRQVTKLDTAFKSASQEVLKGNDIIQKLQAELRNIKSKLKLRNMVTTQQEKVIGDKDTALGRLGLELESVRAALVRREEEVGKLEGSLREAQSKLEESREELKTNENVISWLNKQMNDHMTGGRTVPRPPLTTSITRPTSHSLPNTANADIGTLYSQQMQHRPQFSSTPAVPLSSSSGRPALSSLASKENTRQQVLFRGPGANKGHAPSPLSSHSLSAQSAIKGTSPNGPPRLNDILSKSSPGPNGGAWLDPKYFSQESVQPRPAVTPSLPKTVPPSSYFPKKH